MSRDSTFTSLGLSSPILKAIADQAYKIPTAIQLQAIPPVIKGRDVVAIAQTGTGKSAAFILPILQRLSKGKPAEANQVRALILTPTRELAVQVAESAANYSKYLPLSSEVVYGGVKINPQMMRLRKGADVLVATPGRLLDLYQKNAVKFNRLEVFVLDEADRMLDLGFISDISKIIQCLPKQRQNLMFSATFPDDVRKLARGLVKNSVEISVAGGNKVTRTVKHWVCPVDKKKKPALLVYFIQNNNWQQVLIFVRTKKAANKLTLYLNNNEIPAVAIHGDKSQAARSRALNEFKQNKISILVATDLAARGLDIEQLPCVINFDLPDVAADYIHRIGRTGRAGSEGQAVSLVCADEFEKLSDIEHLLNQLLPRKLIDGFEPAHDVPESRLWKKPAKLKKPKKPKVKRANANTEVVLQQKKKKSKSKFSKKKRTNMPKSPDSKVSHTRRDKRN
ncbi:ATP-dependent RNA helicase RhlE [hydrothermal vent metagenome]|uniref:ATP-dependent RNA helicase RhlE n=1 Tax=hydrothermal vent metagenome TaxID=652676 RepID=A0A3B0XSE0_9ZZZZ